MKENTSHTSTFLPEEFLSEIVDELNDDTVTAIILHGSYVRGNAIAPYSDVDLVRITRETPEHLEQKRFLYRNGYLLSISSRPISLYRERFAKPEQAIFVVPGIREARILLDKEAAFSPIQHEAQSWTWEPLQGAADIYAAQLMTEQTEIVLKVLRALAFHDAVALSDMILDLFSAVTEAIAVQRGVLITSGNTYFHQVQDAVGRDSLWTHYHLCTAGITTPSLSIEERGIAALRLYQEAARLLQAHIPADQWEVIAQSMQTVERILLNEKTF
jgi:predicted nucleotidyltransferase